MSEPFRTWDSHLNNVPGGSPEPGAPGLVHADLDPASLSSLLTDLRVSGAPVLRGRSALSIAGALGGVGRRFLEPEDPIRRLALELLPEVGGMSREMAGEVLDGMALDWTPERLEALLNQEFDDPEVLDRFRNGKVGRSLRALGPELTVHFGAGNVPGVSVTSAIRALLVKSAVFLKPAAGDVVLPVLFARALRQEDPELGRAVSVAYWPREADALTRRALGEADQVVVYGSDASIRRIRDMTPPSTRIVAYHHRLSCGIVGKGALADASTASRFAAEAARAASIFDQRGCVSPHVYFVEEGGAVDPRDWAALLAREMEVWALRLPPGQLEATEASSIQQVRGAAELRAAAGGGIEVFSGSDLGWTVIFDPTPEFQVSCLGRVIRVTPVRDVRDALGILEGVRRHLQTVALVGLDDEGVRGMAEDLARLGVSRVTSLAEEPWPPPWWHHDGSGPLRSLVRWTDLEA